MGPSSLNLKTITGSKIITDHWRKKQLNYMIESGNIPACKVAYTHPSASVFEQRST